MTHRYLIAAALSERETRIEPAPVGDDLEATVDCLRALGAQITLTAEAAVVRPIVRQKGAPVLDCRESASTLRFLLPVAAALYDRFELRGRGRLPLRPNGPLLNALRKNGCFFSSDFLPMRAEGKLRSGIFTVSCEQSSQYLTGLLLALPLLSGTRRVTLSGGLVSAGYAEMTLEALRAFGIEAREENGVYTISENARYRSPGTIGVAGDESAAAFFFAANYLGAGVKIEGLREESPRKDEDFRAILKKLCGGAVIDARDLPDLIPPLAVCACAVRGKVRFEHTGRLRGKESDRVESVCAMIRALGGECEAGEDSLTVFGTGALSGGSVESFGDHRIAMSAAAAACLCKGPVLIRGAEAVHKSYPEFFSCWNQAGGEAYVVDVRQSH